MKNTVVPFKNQSKFTFQKFQSTVVTENSYPTTSTPLLEAIIAENFSEVVAEIQRNSSAVNIPNNFNEYPIQVASRESSVDILQVIIEAGASIKQKDNDGNTLLHYAAQGNNKDTAKFLIETHKMKPFVKTNRLHKSPLETALEKKFAPTVKVMLSLDDIRKEFKGITYDKEFQIEKIYKVVNFAKLKEYFNDIIAQCPRIAKDILDLCMLPAGDLEAESDRLKVHFDLRVFKKKGKDDPVAMMIKKNQESLLNHPVTRMALTIRWGKIRWLYYLIMLANIMMAILFTGYMIISRKKLLNDTVTQEINTASFVLFVATFVLFILNLLLELIFVFGNGIKHFKSAYTWIKLMFYITYFIPVSMNVNKLQSTSKPEVIPFLINIINLFQVWINVLLYLRISQYLGIYIKMFEDILLTFTRLVIPLALMITAYTLTFYCMYQDEESGQSNFAELIYAFFQTTAMFLSNLSSSDVGTDTGHIIIVLRCILYASFMIVMSILLSNLLTGIAIGDIESVQDRAVLVVLSTVADFILATDKIFNNKLNNHHVMQFKKARNPQFLERQIHRVFSAPPLSNFSIAEDIENVYLDNYSKSDQNVISQKNELTESTSVDEQLVELKEKIMEEFKKYSNDNPMSIKLTKYFSTAASKANSNTKRMKIDAMKKDLSWAKSFQNTSRLIESDRLKNKIARNNLLAVFDSYHIQPSAFSSKSREHIRQLKQRSEMNKEEILAEIQQFRGKCLLQEKAIENLNGSFSKGIYEIDFSWEEEDEMYGGLENLKVNVKDNAALIKSLKMKLKTLSHKN